MLSRVNSSMVMIRMLNIVIVESYMGYYDESLVIVKIRIIGIV